VAASGGRVADPSEMDFPHIINNCEISETSISGVCVELLCIGKYK